MNIAAVIVAAGRGERAGQSSEGPKQFRSIGGEPVLRRTLRQLLGIGELRHIVIVHHADDTDHVARALGPLAAAVTLVPGGATRQDSVRHGLAALREHGPDQVLIHDAVRPFAGKGIIGRVIEALGPTHGVLPAVAVTDTLKRAEGGLVAGTVDRSSLFAAQTPQAFPYPTIADAHDRASREGIAGLTDDVALAEWAGLPVMIVPGEAGNVKLTTREDIDMADRRLRAFSLPDIRTGNGYDVHAFEAGDAVTLCGIPIPYSRKLSGHSDADVALHALTDALLATIGAGDIGDHFPPSDPQWKGAASRLFLAHAVSLVAAKGGTILNADISLIAEAPRIGPHRLAMRENLADILAIDVERCSVKATTNEKLGFVGRGEGIAAIATATVGFGGEHERG